MKEASFLETYIKDDQEISISVAPNGDKEPFQIRQNQRDIRVLFYPANALPDISKNTIREHTFIFGRKSPLIPELGWNSFVKKTKGLKSLATIVEDPLNRTYPDKSLPILVEGHPTSLINAARFLDPDNYSLTHLYHAFTQPIKESVYGEFIDLIIAGKFMDSEGKVKTMPDFEGEILMLCTLLGNRKSAEDLIKRKQALLSIDESNSPKKIDLSAKTENGLSINDLIAVHATEYLPFIDELGNMYIRSSFDSSGEMSSRLTVHFALNHYVGSHKEGDWHYKPYVVMAPLVDLINLNGVPSSLRPEDTYFYINPGEALRLPESTMLVLPSKTQNELPKQSIRGKSVAYSENKFSKSDIEETSSHWSEVYWTQYDRMGRDFDIEGSNPFGKTYEHAARFKTLNDFIKSTLETSLNQFGFMKTYPMDGRLESVKELASWFWRGTKARLVNSKDQNNEALGVLMRHNTPDLFSGDTWILPYVTRKLRKVIELELGHINKKIKTDEVISSSGYRVENIDPYYLGYDDLGNNDPFPAWVKGILTLAKKAGLSTPRHGKTTEAEIEHLIDPGAFGSGIRNYLYQKYIINNDESESRPSPKNLKEWTLEAQQELRKKFLDSNPQIRRVVYLMGAYQIGDFWDS